MLWQKESDEVDALYVDLFELENKKRLRLTFCISKLDDRIRPSPKNAEESLKERRMGNHLFATDDFINAIEQYNKSLCLAPPNTEFVSMAYSNRSMCLLRLKMYKQCLVDIELAKQNNYPEHLLFKLDEREADCLRGIADGEEAEFYDIESRLRFDPDETYPCVANVLNVSKDDNGKFSVTAKEDIGVGKTISVEKAFSTHLVFGQYSKCNVCLRRNFNLVPCNGCTTAMFCHGTCENNTFHEGECGRAFSAHGELNAAVMKEVRIILKVIDMFPDVDELSDFVHKKSKQEQPPSVPLTPADDAKLRYRHFLNLPYKPAETSSKQFANVYYTFKVAMDIPKVSAFFNTTKYRRFFVHLLWLHSQITEDNSNWSRRAFEIERKVKNICTHGIIGLSNRFFGVSCAPNVMHSDYNDLSVFITIRPVKKGELLLTSMADYLLLEPRSARQRIFQEKYNDTCKCSRCHGPIGSMADQLEISSDPDFHDVSQRKIVTENVQAMEDKFVSFLTKYGHRPWCDAISKAVIAYSFFLRDKLVGEDFSSDLIDAINELWLQKPED